MNLYLIILKCQITKLIARNCKNNTIRMYRNGINYNLVIMIKL